MAQERARRQLPTLAYDVLHRHGHIPPAILSRTEVWTANSVAEDAAELHEGAQGERAPPGPSHGEERDELQGYKNASQKGRSSGWVGNGDNSSATNDRRVRTCNNGGGWCQDQWDQAVSLRVRAQAHRDQHEGQGCNSKTW